ncbi:MAG TPA: MG2 domain-containing protein, partial [Cyclobacteriaceae bacterium]
MSPTWKKIGIGAAVAIVIGVVFFTQRGASKETVSTSINPAFGEYISSYTAGIVSSNTAIRIVLAQDPTDSTRTSVFSFSPSIDGEATWLDKRTIEFKPEGRLASGQVYEVGFALGKVIDGVPADLRDFEYSFQVIPQNFEIQVVNFKPYVKTELKRQMIEGSLNTADFAGKENVEKMLKAEQAGKSLRLSWTHNSDGKQHTFVVEDVERKEDATTVDLEVSGQPLGINQSATEKVEIPALGDFKVTKAWVEQGSAQAVVIQFSDPLSEKQNLQGLIRLSDLQDLDFEIKDNEVRVYPPVRQTGSRTLEVEAGVRNILNYKMADGSTFDLAFEQLNPSVRFTGNGSILPGSDGLVLPFEAVNLKAVDIKIVKIFESNVLQFLQVNNLQGNNELRRVGKPLVKKMVSLENSGVVDFGKWNRFSIDLSTYINTEPGAIYQVSIDFKRAYASFNCEGSEDVPITEAAFEDQGWNSDSEDSYWDSYEDYYYGNDYRWEDRDNPCTNSYYVNKAIRRNVIASDLGIIAKRGGGGSTVVVVNDIKTTAPLSGVAVDLYDFQQQVIGSATTGSDGKATIASRQTPFALVARNGNQRGYLRLFDGESLSLSNFDVGGEKVSDGLKGFIYGERGVWRPGDSLYLSFVLEDKMKVLPAGHPVVFELQNPQGQVVNRLVRSNSENGFYKFATATSGDAPTGNWLGRVKVGGTDFTQPIKIETVKPNRLKINLDFGVDKLTAGNNNISGNLQVNWLHGAPGKNLKAEFEVTLVPGETKFRQFEEYVFEDPSRDFSSESQKVYEGETDENGHATVNASLNVGGNAPGMLNAVFRGKAFEESGNFSVDRFSIPFYPYQSFTGIRLPKGDAARGMLLTDTTHRVDVVTVDADGNPVSRNGVEMYLYELSWAWWWDQASNGSVNFMSGTDANPIAQGKIRTVNGRGAWNFRVKYPAWGRYFVKAYDPVSGHSTGKIVYIDWPGWAGRARNESSGASMLSFTSDKGSYNVGEQANLVIPGADNSRALISIENGSQVLNTYWLETKAGDNSFSFKIEPSMAPNVFVHVSLLQPHSQSQNNRPIRMYGVIPINVENPETRLQPVIEMPDVLEPGKEVTIKVSEKTKKKMTYTLAMVDEGLLDLTRFKTPDLWNRFYAREALGVKTWDIYDQVMGAYGGKIERLLAIGGDEAANKEDDPKANRFKPVVKFFGPITLNGGSSEHSFVMPQYIGSVKTMLVAGYEGAYGSTEKATPVRKPLMVLATLPRVLGPEEKVRLPITLFTMEKSIRNVKVDVKVSGPVSMSEKSRNVVMNGSDLTVDFEMAVKSETGIAKIEVTASSGSYSSTDVIEIEVRNPNATVTRVVTAVLDAGKSWTQAVAKDGIAGTNSAVLEVSSLPPINLGQRLKYLIQYPYGCIEQTTSSAFPQLYLDLVKEQNDSEKARVQRNVKAGIERLKLFQRGDGGFAYWPGNPDADSWGSTYAGHFLVEAEKKGYFVPNDMIRKWKKFQKSKVTAWRKHQEPYSSELIQAYRLYTLALAGEADLGSMNRLREQGNLPNQALWMLASAYVKAGQPEAARTLIAKLPHLVKPYSEMAYSYGSDLRDEAIILETLILVGDREKAFELVKTISEALSNPNSWMSTQTTAWCLKSVGAFAAGQQDGELKFTWSFDGKETSAATKLAFAQVDLNSETAKQNSLKVVNDSRKMLFVRVITQGTPARGNEEEASSNLDISVSYMDVDGNPIDPTRLEQGTQFVASVSVSNQGLRGAYRNLAINQVFPSGWEINNLRLDEAESRLSGDKPTYQDIRDDRVYTYFDLNPNQRQTVRVLLTATYGGTYYLPGVVCEAMYDKNIYAR